jgi:D-xylose transport system permease protein
VLPELGGGYDGSISMTASGEPAAGGDHQRRVQHSYGVPGNALWLDALLVAVPIMIVVAFVAAMNVCPIANKSAPQGVPIPVLIWAAVALVLSFSFRRTQLGRCVFAMGGNPDAAAFVGIPVRKVTLMLDVSIGKRMVIIGQVLIAAVVFDLLYRRWTGQQ